MRNVIQAIVMHSRTCRVVNSPGIVGSQLFHRARSWCCSATDRFGYSYDVGDVAPVTKRRQARQQKRCTEIAPVDSAIQDRRAHSKTFPLKGFGQLAIAPCALGHALLNQQLGLQPPAQHHLRLRWRRGRLGAEQKGASLGRFHLLRFAFLGRWGIRIRVNFDAFSLRPSIR